MVLTTVIILVLVGCFLNGRRRGLLMMVLYAATYLELAGSQVSGSGGWQMVGQPAAKCFKRLVVFWAAVSAG